MADVSMKTLKKTAKLLNEATYKNSDGEEVKFLDEPIKIVGAKQDALAATFKEKVEELVGSLEEEALNQAPEEIAELYNDLTSEAPAEEEKEAAGEEEKEEPAEKPKKGKGEVKEKGKEKAKPKKKPIPPGKERELSRYGHTKGTQAGDLDDAVFKGGTLDEISAEADVTRVRARSHVKHLEAIGVPMETTEVERKKGSREITLPHYKTTVETFTPSTTKEKKEKKKKGAK